MRFKKLLSLLVGFILILSFSLPLFVFAQEITPTPTPEVSLTPEPTPTLEPTLTPEPTPTEEITPTPTPEPLPTQEVTPIPTEEPPVFIPEPPIDKTKTPSPAGPGAVEGFGTKFEITDSGYFNLITQSSEEVYLKMESIPEMIVLRIRAPEGITKTRLTIFGFEQETVYHKYADDYSNHEEITSDLERTISFDVDLDPDKTRLIYIQPRPSTKFLRSTTTGGDCTLIGTWNNTTKTCTLTTDLTESIQIENSGITLDGNGRTITGTNSGYGVYILSQLNNITVKNLTIKKFSYGIFVNSLDTGIMLTNNTITQNTSYGIFISNNTSNNTITNNIISDNYYGTNSSFGIYIYDSTNNYLSGNTISGSKYNFFLYGTTDANLNHSIGTTNTVDGKAIYYLKNVSSQTFDATTSPSIGTFYCISCSNVVVKDLTLTKNGYGIFFYKPASVTVRNNSLSNNYYGISITTATIGTTLIKDNNLTDNYYGIHLNTTTGIEVRTNTITNSYEYGIGLMYNSNNTILAGNTISNTSNYGLRFDSSSNATLTGNQISSGSGNYTFYLSDCYSDSYCDHTIDTTNLLNGKIFYYFKNISNQTYDNLSNPGMVFIYKGNNVTVKNMNLDGVKTTAGVYFFKTNNSRIENIRVNDNSYTSGIQLYSSNYNTVTGNNISNTYNESLYMRYSSNNIITNNVVTGRGNRGYSISYSSNNNQFSGNSVTGIYSGFYVSSSSYNTFTGNTANNNNYGFDHSNATYNTWNGNNAENNSSGGFDLYNSKNNTIVNNISKKNKYGVHLYYNAQNNIIYDNTFTENAGSDYSGAGIRIEKYSGNGVNNNNQIYRNNFLNNATQVKFDTGAGTGNVFNLPLPTGGNYWSDWSEPDANGDGFIDTPYVFANGSDALPRLCPGGTLNIDKIPPVTTANLSGDMGSSGWYKSNVSVSLSASDIGSCGQAPSGVAITQYSFDKINWSTYITPINVTDEGIKNVYYRSTDVSGNIEGTGQETITLIDDKVIFPGWTVVRGTWVTENQEFSATGPSTYPTDAFASKGDLSWKNYTIELKFNPQNTSSWGIYLGTRYNGNPSPYGGGISRYAFILTGTQQLINKCVLGTCYGQNYLTNYTLAGNVWHTIKVELNGNKQRYYLNGTFYYEVTDSALANGNIFLQVYGSPRGHMHFDNILVTSVQPIPPSTIVKIDKIAPVVNESISGTMGANNWYVSDVTATLTATDNNDIDKIEYSYDNTNWQTYSAPVVLTSSGETMFYYRAIDLAGNVAEGSQLIKIDKTAPLTSITLSGTQGENNWYVGDVTVTLAAVDNEGGMDQGKTEYSFDGTNWQNYTGQVTITSEGTTTIKYRSTDNAGNQETAKQAIIKIDKTNPTIIGSRTPDANAYNWNKENVTVTFSCNDTGSGIADCTDLSIISTEGVNQYVDGVVTDKAGNTANFSVTGINIDKTKPQVTNIIKPDTNENGWFKNDVTVSYACADNLSGPVNSSGSQTIATEGENQSVNLDCADLAGNTTQTIEAGINIDKTSPTIAGQATTDPNSNGWYKNDVVVHFTASDALSEIQSLTPDITLFSEGENQSAEGTALDKAGNSAVTTISGINIDKTKPMITGNKTPNANVNGWNNTDVVVHFECTDSLSGKDSLNSDETITTEGKDQTRTGTCTDKAGNSEIATVNEINIDKTKPDISIISPVNGDYLLNQSVLADWGVSDVLSGVERTTATVDNGQPINTTQIGLNSFTVESIDYAGNTNLITVNYYVVYNFSGVLPPININGKSIFKLKQTIPVKFKIFDVNGNPVANALAYLNLAKLSNNVLGNEIEADSTSQATEGNLFRYDPVSEQYIFNLNTKNMTSGAWVLKIYLDDERVEEVQISLR